MSTTSRPDDPDAAPASDVAASLREAAFVRVLARADGDCLAAAGLLARVLDARGVPYQVRVARFGDGRDDEAGDDDATDDAAPDDAAPDDADHTTVGVGLDPAADAHLPTDGSPASVTAFDAAAALDCSPDPALALAGTIVAECPPGAGESAHVAEAARESGVERRPGVGVPTDDLADGLAHTTLAHAGYSGDTGAAQATLAELGLPAELDDSAQRQVASEFALAVAGDDRATDRAGDAVERALRPHDLADGPFATVEGYADVLDAVARERPGVGVALALGHDVRADALDAWRDHAERAHEAVRTATTGRYDGLLAVRVGGEGSDDAENPPVETVARLVRDFRSPEPVVLVVGSGEAAAVATADAGVGQAMAEVAADLGGRATGAADRGYARLDPDTEAETVLTAFREALS